MKLLITDDQNSVHMFLDKMVPWDSLGITTVFHARNGEEALEVIESEWPEILMLDICMPVMDGLALLEKISSLVWEHRVVILSAFNEFEYARKCMIYGVKDYLLKPIDTGEVRSTLEKAIKEISEERKEKMEMILKDFVETGKEENEIPGSFENSGYGVVCYKNGDVPDLSYSLEQIFIADAGEVTIEFRKVKDAKEWNEFFSDNSDQKNEITVGFSRFCSGKEDFYRGVREGLEALQQGFYGPGVFQYCENAMNVYPQKEAEKLSRQLSDSYESGDVQNMKQAVEKLFFIFQRANVHPRYVQEFCYGCLIHLNQNFMEALKKLKSSFLFSEFYFSDAAGVKNMFMRLMIGMRMEIAPQEVQTDEDVVERILHYVDRNYEKDLSLNTLSQHFFISKYQISRLFKKQYGMNFSDYVLKVRMEASSMMLTNSTEKIDEIARRSGFEETSYFSRVFSKYYGISPGEYRKQNKGGFV